MLKILLLSILLFSFSFSSQENVKHLKADGKGVMFIFESKTCQYCDLLKKDFKENKHMKELSKDFNIYYLDKDNEKNFIVGKTKKKESTTTLKIAFMVRSTPTIIIFDKNWNKIFELPGYAHPEQMITFMKFVKGLHSKKYTPKDWQKFLKDNGVS